MSTPNPRILAFCKRWGSRHLRVALLNAIDAAFPMLGTLVPPINPYDLAKMRGIAGIVDVELENDGLLLSLEGGGYIVHLNRRHSENRKRFTLAHEIGHTLLFDTEAAVKECQRAVKLAEQLVTCDPGDEEGLCNVAAIELLMPRRQLQDAIALSGYGAAGVVQLAKLFRTT